MICTRNSVSLYLEEYDGFRICDAYQLDGYWLFRTTPRPIHAHTAKATATVHRIHHWFDEHGPGYGVMVAEDSNVTISGDWS